MKKNKRFGASLFISTAIIFLAVLFPCFLRGQVSTFFLYEKNYSPYSSAQSFLAAKNALYYYKNRFIGTKIFPENALKDKLIGATYRSLSSFIFEYTIDRLILITQHEVFGHGFRQREFGFSNNVYNIKLGLFGYSGFARLGDRLSGRVYTNHEKITRVLGGKEAEGIISKVIFEDWFQAEKINNHQVILYLRSVQKFTSILLFDSDENMPRDLDFYLSEINPLYKLLGKNDELTTKAIRRGILLDLLNPTLYTSAYAFLIDYIIKGKESAPLFMFSFGNKIKYLPNTRFSLAPYGIEFYFENYLKYDQNILSIYSRIGKGTFETSWGFGVVVSNVIKINKLKITPHFHLWQQPELFLGKVNGTIIRKEGIGVGGVLDVRLSLLNKNGSRVNLTTVVGYKSKGYLEGYKLKDGIILRLGFSFSSK